MSSSSSISGDSAGSSDSEVERIPLERKMISSNLFQPYKAIGYVIDHLPFCLNKLGEETFICCSIKKSFQVYKASNLVLSVVSPVLNKKIRCLYAFRDLTFTSVGNEIIKWKRVNQVCTYQKKQFSSNIKKLLCFGNYLISVNDDDELLIWNIDSDEFVSSVDLDIKDITVICHPHTYLNKILVASDSGRMQLWNIRINKMVYDFESFQYGIRCIEQSPIVDIVAIGLTNGDIFIHNLRYDKSIIKFHQTGGSITSLSFRTDITSPSYMSSTNDHGDIVVWNLDEKEISTTIKYAHDGVVTKAEFLNNEPILISSGTDNKLKEWIFDQEDESARLLRSRQGHKLPPKRIRYYGGHTLSTLTSGADAACCQILSAGSDQAFRMFHTAREQQNVEFSQGNLTKQSKHFSVRIEELKLNKIISFDATEARERDWSNILTAHEEDINVYTWKFDTKAISGSVLRPDGSKKKLDMMKVKADQVSNRTDYLPKASVVAISSCGNFGVVGCENGMIFRYNMQSGLPRGCYPRNALHLLEEKDEYAKTFAKKGPLPGSVFKIFQLNQPAGANKQHKAQPVYEFHSAYVSGVCVDALNDTLVSGSYDGTLRFWDFNAHTLRHTVDVGSPVTQLILNRENGVLAAACDDLVVRVFELSSRRLIRRFKGHHNKITDMCFNSTSRWLLTASVDASVRVWDLPTARCIDWMSFNKPVTSLTFSPTGEFLATSHVDLVGIYLWANNAHFGTALGDRIATKPSAMDLPTPAAAHQPATEKQSATGGKRKATAKSVPAEDEQDEPLPMSQDALLRLSGQPAARWFTLAHLELIKERNRPQEPVQKPELAPFFIPTSKSINPVFVPQEAGAGAGAGGAGDAAVPLPSFGDMGGTEWGEDAGDEELVATTKIIRSSGFAKPRSKLMSLLEECHARQAAVVEAPPDDSDEDSDQDSDDEAASDRLKFALFAARRKAAFFEPVVLHLNTLSPSAVDFDLQNVILGVEDDDGIQLLRVLFDWLSCELRAKTNFELVQAVLNRLLTVHADVLSEVKLLRDQLAELLAIQKQSWGQLNELLQQNMCLIKFYSHLH